MPYWSLPLSARDAIEREVGAVTSASSLGTGLNSSVAAIIRTQQGRYFIKALPADHRWVWTQRREAEIAPYVTEFAPALVSRVVHSGWDVLIFEALGGTPASYRPGSTHLGLVGELLTKLGDTPCPAIELREAPLRLQAYAEDSELHYFTGQALLHTDLNNANVIVENDQARLVDWGWATRGAPWLDAAYWVIWLIAAGDDPAAAEDLAATVPSWQQATADGIDAFAAANARVWTEIGGTEPDSFTKPLLEAAKRWAQYRTRQLR
ncbi:hypothetical protein [Actinoplanes sp. NPDC051411]|uniref:hypothetical protein n=1 Tax=Actinoplanes sp. NPDC051411 TaxID=3155522 RepID=UPI0034385EC6